MSCTCHLAWVASRSGAIYFARDDFARPSQQIVQQTSGEARLVDMALERRRPAGDAQPGDEATPGSEPLPAPECAWRPRIGTGSLVEWAAVPAQADRAAGRQDGAFRTPTRSRGRWKSSNDCAGPCLEAPDMVS